MRKTTCSFLLTGALLALGCGSHVDANSSGSSGSTTSSASASSGDGGQGSAASVASSTGQGGFGMGGFGMGGSGAGTGGTGGSGGDNSGCAELAPIQLGPGTIGDSDMNGTWSPGEAAEVNVVMMNTSNADINYPGVEIISSDPKVSTQNPYNAFFVLFANQASAIGVSYIADPSVAPGTVVTFTATLHSISDVSCTNLPTLTFTATIQ